MTKDDMLDRAVLFPQPIFDRLVRNGSPERRDRDHAPVVLIKMPMGHGIWLLSEAEPFAFDEGKEADDWSLFGLCDLGEPELGPVLRSELETVRLPKPLHMLGLERDVTFDPDTALPMSVYYDWARQKGEIRLDVDLVEVFPWAFPDAGPEGRDAARALIRTLDRRRLAVFARFLARVDDVITEAQKGAFHVREAAPCGDGLKIRWNPTGDDVAERRIASLAVQAEDGITAADEWRVERIWETR